MKLNNLLQARNVLSAHANDKLPFALAYKIMKFLKASNSEYTFYNEKLKELITFYGEKGDNGEIITAGEGVIIAGGKIEDCKKEIEALGATEATTPPIKFSLDELSLISLSANDLYFLEEFIEGDKDVN